MFAFQKYTVYIRVQRDGASFCVFLHDRTSIRKGFQVAWNLFRRTNNAALGELFFTPLPEELFFAALPRDLFFIALR